MTTNFQVCATNESILQQGISSPLTPVGNDDAKAYSQTSALIYLLHLLALHLR